MMTTTLAERKRTALASAQIVRFIELPVGARFEFRGHRYEKVDRGFAADEDRAGNLFHADTEVLAHHGTATGRSDVVRRTNGIAGWS